VGWPFVRDLAADPTLAEDATSVVPSPPEPNLGSPGQNPLRLAACSFASVALLLGHGETSEHHQVESSRCMIGSKLHVVGKGLGSSEGGASWSPNSRKLAFPSGQRSPTDLIYTVNADGTGLRRLTHSGNDAWPAWSPDGRKIAFQSDAAGFDDVYLMNADGRKRQRLTRSKDYPGATDPAWSPDGHELVFSDDFALYVMRRDGTHKKLLTAPPRTSPLPSEDFSPAWSPDGRKIVFTQRRTNRSIQIYVVNDDGSGKHELTRHGANLFPTWSPDARRIVFNRALPTKHGSNFTLASYVMNANGTQQQPLTPRKNLGTPLWAPNGHMIAFAGNQLYVTTIRCS
jgi:Tol biopolymer transport system component